MADLMFPWLFQHSELGLRSLAGTTIEQRTFTTVYVSELRRPVEFTLPGAGVKARRSEASFWGYIGTRGVRGLRGSSCGSGSAPATANFTWRFAALIPPSGDRSDKRCLPGSVSDGRWNQGMRNIPDVGCCCAAQVDRSSLYLKPQHLVPQCRG